MTTPTPGSTPAPEESDPATADAGDRRLETHPRPGANERLAAIGTMAAGLCHDMNNLLLPIRGHLDATEAGGLTPDQQTHVESLREAVGFLQQLTDSLRLFAIDPDDPGDGPTTTDVAAWWIRIGPLLAHSIPAHIELDIAIDDDAIVALAPHRLTQAVLNLLINAGDAVGGRGRIRVRTTRSSDDTFLRLSVTDNGRGMSPDALRHAVDPLFTTGPRPQSTGLGLSLVHGIVRAAGGRMHFDSAGSRGTTVTLELPIVARQIEPAMTAVHAPPRPRPASHEHGTSAASARAVRIFCVDDHPVLLDGLRARIDLARDLAVAGSLPCADGLVDAVRTARPDVVMLDIEMPGPDPFEAARDLLRSAPGVRIAFLSAYVRDHFLDAALEAGAWGYFYKGDDLDSIIDGIRRIARGEHVMGPRVRDRSGTGHRARPGRGSRLTSLSPRETQILSMIGRGLSRTEIADVTHRSVKTIDTHRATIMEKLDIHDRTELALFAVREGLV